MFLFGCFSGFLDGHWTFDQLNLLARTKHRSERSRQIPSTENNRSSQNTDRSKSQ